MDFLVVVEDPGHLQGAGVALQVLGQFKILKLVAWLAAAGEVAIEVARAIARSQQPVVFLKVRPGRDRQRAVGQWLPLKRVPVEPRDRADLSQEMCVPFLRSATWPVVNGG